MTVDIEHPALGVLRQAGIPIELAETPGAIRTPPPLLGEHSDAVLAELGYRPEDIDRFRDSGVI